VVAAEYRRRHVRISITRDRIAQLIYLDAFVPEEGQSLLDLLSESEPQRVLPVC